jgi:hypothetical protein
MGIVDTYRTLREMKWRRWLKMEYFLLDPYRSYFLRMQHSANLFTSLYRNEKMILRNSSVPSPFEIKCL